VWGRCRPSQQIGGDYYDHAAGVGGTLTALIADVSGHDVASALFMAQARVVFKEAIARGASPAEILARTNDVLAGDLIASGLFLSAFAARYDPATGTLEFADAGHNRPLLYRAATGRCETVATEGFLIGVKEETEYRDRRASLAPGDALVLYTDGVVEARDGAGEFFGDARLGALVEARGGEPAEALGEGIFEAVEGFAGAAPLRDDVTVVVVRIPGPPRGKVGT
jgi:serine phosphatase RsbU (regulator of sigma subunit)